MTTPVLALIAAVAVHLPQTSQLPGIDGVIDKVHQIGTQGPLYFTLKSIEYSVSRFTYGGHATIPNSDQKLLRLKFTIQNPVGSEVKVENGSIRFTAVSERDQNFENAIYFGIVDTKDTLSMRLKPAQKVEVEAAILIPNDVDIRKLIVLPRKGDTGKVIRYNISGHVQPLPELFRKNELEYHANEVVEAPRDTFLPMSVSDISVPAGPFGVSATAGSTKAPRGQAYYSVIATLRNGHSAEWTPKALYLKGEMAMPNGTKIKLRFCRVPGTDQGFSAKLLPGATAKAEFIFQAVQDAKPVSVRIWETNSGGVSRSYQYKFN